MALKHKLGLEEFADFGFFLAGIRSDVSMIELCWHLNQTLHIDLEKAADVEWFDRKTKMPVLFSLFQSIVKPAEMVEEEEDAAYNVHLADSWHRPVPENPLVAARLRLLKRDEHDDQNTLFQLVENRSHAHFLIPEQKVFPYFLIIRGEEADTQATESVVKQLRGISVIEQAFRIDPQTLKSKDHLIF